MSKIYIQRLRAVEAEFNAAQQAIAYLERNWQSQGIFHEVERVTPRDLAWARQRLEATYFVRLFAEFEGVLKDHLATNHPQVKVPARPKVDWVMNRVMQVEPLQIDPVLRRKIDAVRDYRNSIAHLRHNPPPTITLVAALSVLNTFVARLPDPLT